MRKAARRATEQVELCSGVSPPRTPADPARRRPPHCLDYFHGALHLDPSGSRIADDGWNWGPVTAQELAAHTDTGLLRWRVEDPRE